MNPRTILSAGLGLLAVGTVMAASVTPARADGDDWRWRRQEWREHEARERAWREHEWRERHPPQAYYRPYGYAPPPPAYYAPPPVRYGW